MILEACGKVLSERQLDEISDWKLKVVAGDIRTVRPYLILEILSIL